MVYSPDREARRARARAVAGARALLVGEGKRTVRRRASACVIGRSRECDLVLDDPNVSRRHAELRREGDGWVVADLGSTNGIKVNGRRVDEARASARRRRSRSGLTDLTFELE